MKVLRNKEILEFNIKLAIHKRLIPAHISGKPPSYFIVAGFVFTTVSVPYLRSEVLLSLFPYFLSFSHASIHSLYNYFPIYVLQYGKEYEFDAPVKLLEKHLHAMAQSVDEQLVVVSQVGFSCFTLLCSYNYYFSRLMSKPQHPYYYLQVLVSDINIGYEEIVNTQVCKIASIICHVVDVSVTLNV